MRTSSSSPRISVVLPTHDRPDLLAEAIESVRAQTHGNWQLIVVDDASTPPAAVPDDARIEIIRNASSCGGAQSKNIGARHATGDLLAFLDDDDLYAPTYLERASAALSENSEIDVVFMGVSWFGERGEAGQRAYEKAMESLIANLSPFTTRGDVVVFDREKLFNGLLRTVPMAFQRPVLRRSMFERVGSYQPDILLWDCDWAIRAALQAKCALISDGLYLQRAAGQGFSSQHDRRTEHLRSNVLMKKRLLQTPLSAAQHSATKEALKDLWFGAAWSSYRDGKLAIALEYLWNSARINPTPAHLKLLIRIALGKLKLTLR